MERKKKELMERLLLLFAFFIATFSVVLIWHGHTIMGSLVILGGAVVAFLLGRVKE